MERISIRTDKLKNIIQTFWQQSDVDLANGMDFQPRGSIFVRFTHLNHREFTYRFIVNNKNGAHRQGTCRIFLSPKYDERGNPWLFRDHKDMFIELDRFAVSRKYFVGFTSISIIIIEKVICFEILKSYEVAKRY